jgi:hypothetical protein
MPEWYAILMLLTSVASLGVVWAPLLWLAPLAGAALAATVTQAISGGLRAGFGCEEPFSPAARLGLRVLTAWLHLIQPMARLLGRVRYGLGPWQRGRGAAFSWPWPRIRALWSETWRTAEDRLEEFERALRRTGTGVARGGDFDPWDLGIRGGLLGRVRTVVAIEEHGAGRQLVRLRAWPHVPGPAVWLMLLLVGLAALAAADAAWPAAAVLAVLAAGLAVRAGGECGAAMGAWELALRDAEGIGLSPEAESRWRLLPLLRGRTDDLIRR